MSALGFRQQFQGTELSGRCPVSHFWDESEPRLFVCETVPVSSESSSTSFVDTVKTAPSCRDSAVQLVDQQSACDYLFYDFNKQTELKVV